MSSIKLESNASGTGIFTIASPNSNTNRTLTLPDSTGTILTGSSAIAVSQLPAGSVIQVVSATYSTSVNITSTSYVDTGLTGSITPTSASSKILVIVNQSMGHYQATNAARLFELQLLRGATMISDRDVYSYGAVGSNTYFETGLDGTQIVLDSPATTSSTTYKTQAKMDSTANDTRLVFQQGSGKSSIILMEIAA